MVVPFSISRIWPYVWNVFRLFQQCKVSCYVFDQRQCVHTTHSGPRMTKWITFWMVCVWHLTIPLLHFDDVKWWQHLTKKSNSTQRKNVQTFSHANIKSFDIYIYYHSIFAATQVKTDFVSLFFFLVDSLFCTLFFKESSIFFCIHLNHTVFVCVLFRQCLARAGYFESVLYTIFLYFCCISISFSAKGC